jgi:hypothetical protein
MQPRIKQLLIKFCIYLIVGFVCAFFWYKLKAW